MVSIPLARDVTTILAALEVKRPAVAAHCRRVAAYGVQLATHYGLPYEMIETIRVGSLLHDIGKLMVPTHILAKPGRLTEQEWRSLQSHPEQGFEMAQQLGFPPGILDIVLYHHERNDSSGYPDGLEANAIPWTVRIVSVMDAFDALTSPRTYREALSVEAARTLLAREAIDRVLPVGGQRPAVDAEDDGRRGGERRSRPLPAGCEAQRRRPRSRHHAVDRGLPGRAGTGYRLVDAATVGKVQPVPVEAVRGPRSARSGPR